MGLIFRFSIIPALKCRASISASLRDATWSINSLRNEIIVIRFKKYIFQSIADILKEN
jgi:hypothetical protein